MVDEATDQSVNHSTAAIPPEGFDSVPLWDLAEAGREILPVESFHSANWINARAQAPHDACQVCSSIKVVIQPSLVPIVVGETSEDGSPLAHANLVTICYNCGYTRLFNAAVLGLRPRLTSLTEFMGGPNNG